MNVAPGAISQSIDVFIGDDSGLGVTGLLAATFPPVFWTLAGATAATSITLSDLALITTAYTSGGVKERSGGWYRLDVPNAAMTTAGSVRIFGEATGKHLIAEPIIVGGQVDLVSAPNATAVTAIQLGLATSAALATLQTAVNNLNNLSALANIYVPQTLVKPASGTIAYPITLIIRDTEGHLVDTDGLSASVSVANTAGTDRSGGLSVFSRIAVGVYEWTYTVNSTDTDEGLRFAGFGVVGGQSRRADASSAVTDTEALSTLTAIKAQTDKIGTNSADSPNAATSQTSVTSALADLVLLLARTDPSTALAAVKTVTDKLATMLAPSGGNSTFTADALKNAATSSGMGTFSLTVHVIDSNTGLPLTGASVRATASPPAGPVPTDSSGNVTITLNSGAATIGVDIGGYVTYSSAQVVDGAGHWVSSGTTTLSVALTPATVLATPPAGKCNISGYVTDASGNVIANAAVKYRMVVPPPENNVFDGGNYQVLSDVTGLFEIPARQLAEYEVWYGNGSPTTKTTTTAAQQTLDSPVISEQRP